MSASIEHVVEDLDNLFYNCYRVPESRWIYHLASAQKHRDALVSLYEDTGSVPVSAICAVKRKTPQEMKAQWGKSAWKRACKISDVDAVMALAVWNFSKEQLALYLEHPGVLSFIWKNKRSIPKNLSVSDTYALLSVVVNHYGYYLNELRLQAQEELRMGGDLAKWAKDPYRVHAETTERYMRSLVRNYSKDGVVRKVYSGKGWEARELSPDQVVEEGDNMSHCVGCYADAAVNGTYAVFHVEDDSRKGFTIGLSKDDQGWFCQQAYGFANAELSTAQEQICSEVEDNFIHDKAQEKLVMETPAALEEQLDWEEKMELYYGQ